jgi:hypothetical protein
MTSNGPRRNEAAARLILPRQTFSKVFAMKKPILFILTALLLASGAAFAGDRGAHWGERHHHRHHRHYAPPPVYYPEHHHHHHHHRPSYSYYYDPRPSYYAPPYYNPGFNAYIQQPNYGFRFGFSGNWIDR